MADVRIDKYLWAIRAFKTRSEAADACKGGRVKTGQVNAKPSKLVQAGDILHVRKGAITFVYKVVQPNWFPTLPRISHRRSSWTNSVHPWKAFSFRGPAAPDVPPKRTAGR